MKKPGCLKAAAVSVIVAALPVLAFAILVWPQFGSHGEYGGTRAYFSLKYAGAGTDSEPAEIPDEILPEVQFENHTCGFHALSSIYRSHQLDPEEMKLRLRLGVDRPSVTADSTTTGSLPPDLLRVAMQDGFSVELVDLEKPDAAASIRAHLGEGRFVLTLITTESTGALHWVVLAGSDDAASDSVTVIDSLATGPCQRNLEDYLSNQVLSATLMSMDRGGVPWKTRHAHAAGIAEMRKILTRQGNRE